MLMDLDRKILIMRNRAMKSQSLDVEEADSDFFSMMREDIVAEAERIKDIPLPAERPVVKAVEKQSSTLSMEELMALDDVGFIENAYRKLLHRQIDVDGAYQYLARLRSGKMSKEQLIYILRTSEEGKRCGESIEDFYLKQPRFEWFSAFEGREFVENLYTWLLGRPADEAGLSDLERQLENGVSKQAIFAAVLNSPERTGKESDPATSPETETDDKPEIVDYDALLMLDDAEFVENVYRQILGREADSAGASHWLRACRMGEKTKDDMIFELRMSGEGVRKGVFISGARCDEAQLEKLTVLKGTDFITNMFMWVLGRSVDETGMRNYRDMMKKGVSKHAILKNIAGSQEALKRKEKYEALKADAVAAPVNPEGDYGGSSLRSAESAVRDAVSKRQMEEAISKMQERWGSQTDMLYQHTALDALRISLLQRQLRGIADSLNGFQQQIDQMRRQATDQAASIRDEMAQKLDGISKSVFPKIEEMKAGFVLELESVRTELDEQTEARLAELRAELGEQTDAKLAAIRDELGGQTEARLAAIRDELGEQTEGKLAEIRTELGGQTEGKLAEIRTELDGQTDAKLAELRTALDGQVEARLNEAAKSAQDASERAVAALETKTEQQIESLNVQVAEKSSIRQVEKITEDMGAMAREVMLAKWKIIDHMRKDTEKDTDILTCDICGDSHPRGEYKTMETDCIFNGGHLTRYICPKCGVVFGPSKFVNQGQKGIDEDYWVHYLGYSESDATFKEERAFQLLNPSKDKVYLNYGCGKWNETLEKLQAAGYTVYGYEPYAPDTDNPYMITRKEDLAKMKFDGIFSNDLLEHLINPIEDLKFMKSLLLDENSRMAHGTACYAYKYEYTRFHTHFFLGKSVKIMAEKAGLDIVGHADDMKDYDLITYIYAPREINVDLDCLDWMIRPEKTERVDGILRMAEGGLICGPYYTLPFGKYQTELHINCLQSDEKRVARYKITAEKGTRVISEGSLKRGSNSIVWSSDVKVTDFEVVVNAEQDLEIDQLKVRRIKQRGGRSK